MITFITQEMDRSVALIEFEASFLLFLVTLVLFALVIYRFRGYLSDARYLAMFFAFSTFASFLYFIDSPLLPFVDMISADVFLVLQSLSFGVAFTMFYLHSEYNRNDQPHTLRLFIVGTLIGLMVISDLAYLMIVQTDLLIGNQVLSNEFLNLFYSMKELLHFGTVIFTYLISIIAFTLGAFNQWTTSRGKDKKDIVFTIVQGSFAVEMFSFSVFEFLNLMGIISRADLILGYSIVIPFIALSGLVFTSLYAIYPKYLYKVPVDLRGLILILPNGTPLLHVIFESYTKNDEMETSLVSGFLNAMATFTNQVFNEDIEQIKALNSMILQKRLENHIVVAISSRTSRMFRNAFNRFVETFSEMMVEGVDRKYGEVEKMEYSSVAFEKAMKQIFPFLKVKEIKRYV